MSRMWWKQSCELVIFIKSGILKIGDIVISNFFFKFSSDWLLIVQNGLNAQYRNPFKRLGRFELEGFSIVEKCEILE